MGIASLPVRVDPDTVRQYLSKLDDRGESYSFNVYAWDHGNPGRLVLNRDGNDDVLEIFLFLDGTWLAKHKIDIGDNE